MSSPISASGVPRHAKLIRRGTCTIKGRKSALALTFELCVLARWRNVSHSVRMTAEALKQMTRQKCVGDFLQALRVCKR
jgi:hypothetical protein